jgi:hypothetical protein
MNSINQKSVQPIEKWFTEINPRNRKQLTSLGNYLAKLEVDENEIDLIKSRANMIPGLEVLNMKFLARVLLVIIRSKIPPNSNIFPLEMPKGGERKTSQYQETLLNELRATWLRYMEKCLPYSDVWNEPIEAAAYRAASDNLSIGYGDINRIENILLLTPEEISAKVREFTV